MSPWTSSGSSRLTTSAALVAAAAGATVAKHGNRAASGNVGAADVLEALGAAIELGPEEAVRCVSRCGVVFLFAQIYHPAVRHVGPARRELGFRTLFNLTGPLCNPAGVRRQVLGLFSPDWLEPVAEALRCLGSEHVLVVHGGDGSDEITPCAETTIVELRDGAVRRFSVTPEDFGLRRSDPADMAGGADAAAAAAMLREVLGGAAGAAADAVALNGGAAIHVAGIAASLGGGVARAREILRSGEALAALDRFIVESCAARDAAQAARGQGTAPGGTS
jgi:anthranilate phosphoribosyltransferase